MRKTWKLLGALGLAAVLVLTLAVDAEAGKKKRRKKKNKKVATQTEEIGAAASSASTVPAARLATEFGGAVSKADRHLRAYETAAAEAALRSLENEREPAVLLARARVFEQNQDYDRAVGLMEEAAAAASGSPEPLVYLGEALLHAQRLGAADDAFSRAEGRAREILKSDPNDYDALYFLGVAQQRQKRFAAAEETLLKVHAKQPRNALAAYQLGATLAFKEDWGGAISALDEAVNLDSGIAYAYYYRGLAAGRIGRKDLLVNDLDRFLAMAPRAPEAARAQKILDAAR